MDGIDEEDLYMAGHPAPPGRYLRLGGPDDRSVVISVGDVLPASLDGHVALYVRVPELRAAAQRPTAATAA